MKFAALLVLALLAAFSAEWIPHYAAHLPGSNLTTIGRLGAFEVPCTDSAPGELICRNQYHVPAALLAGEGESGALGLGMVLSASEIFCEGEATPLATYGDRRTASRALELQAVYQTVVLPQGGCPQGLLVRAWSPQRFNRTGYIGGALVRGDRSSVELLRRTVEFFAAELYLITSVMLALFLAIQRWILRPARIGRPRRDEWYSMAGYWVAFALIKGGLIEVLVPALSRQLLFLRLSNFVSLMAHTLPLLHVLGAIPGSNSRLKRLAVTLMNPLPRVSISPLALIVAGVCLAPQFAGALSLWGFALVLPSIAAGLRLGRPDVLCFALALLLECLKIRNLPFAPVGSTSLIYVTGLLLLEFRMDMIHASAAGGVLNWWRALQVPSGVSPADSGSLLISFAERFRARRITLLEPYEGGAARLVIRDRSGGSWTSEVRFLESIPRVFSHCLTTRLPLWNVDEKSEFGYRLRKGAEPLPGVGGAFFSVIPVTRNGEVVAAFALTGYDEAPLSPLSSPELAEFGTQLMNTRLADLVHAESAQVHDSWYRSCIQLTNELNQLAESRDSKRDLVHFMDDAAAALSRALESSVLIGRVQGESRELDLKVTAGFRPDVAKLYHETRFQALAVNVQGPMPLAVNERRIVSVSDLGWLRGVLHPRSLEAFDRSGARSGAAIPINISDHGSGREAAWGVIWLESDRLGKFNAHSQAGLRLVAAALEAYIGRALLRTRAQDALGGLARSDIAERLLTGQSVLERDHGLLLMADVRGSTRTAQRYGGDAWKSFMARVEPGVRELGAAHGFTLQLIVWDACFFTRTSEIADPALVEGAVAFGRALNRFFREELQKDFPEQWTEAGPDGIRLCMDFGDTTRDLLNGTWTIIGSSMARVHKLEATCKKLEGWCFFAGDLPVPAGMGVEETLACHPSTGLGILTLLPSTGG